MPGAMPFLHRWWGNPMFSAMARHWFKAEPIHDVYCGLRGFTKEFYHRLNQRCTGMEFATEMIIKASLFREKISEVPITLHPDGRKSHAPHLKTFRDGWRTLRFFLMYSPRWLFVIPGVLFDSCWPDWVHAGHAWHASGRRDLRRAHAALCQFSDSLRLPIVLFAIFTKTFAIGEGLMPEDPLLHVVFPGCKS